MDDYSYILQGHESILNLKIDGIGWSYNALAFRCNIMPCFCAARVPHITICRNNKLIKK